MRSNFRRLRRSAFYRQLSRFYTSSLVALGGPELSPLTLCNGGDDQRTQPQLERPLAPRLGGPPGDQLLLQLLHLQCGQVSGQVTRSS